MEQLRFSALDLSLPTIEHGILHSFLGSGVSISRTSEVQLKEAFKRIYASFMFLFRPC